MNIIRFVLGRIILFLDWMTSPKPIPISRERIEFIQEKVKDMEIYEFKACPFCVKAKNLLKSKGIEYEEKNIAEGYKIQDLLEMVPNARTMPQIWLGEEHIGGYYELEAKLKEME